MRSFIAIDLPTEVRSGLKSVSNELKTLGLNGRTARLESIHLTLKFLGEVQEGQVESIEQVMKEACSGIGSFPVTIRRVGAFPHLQRPRVVWIGVEAPQGLFELQSRLEDGLSDLGFEPEGRAFKPHLTLMRVKSPKNVENLGRFIAREGVQADAGSFEVGEYHLFQSFLLPEGARYRKLASVGLKE